MSWGDGGGTGLVSVQYSFKGESAHAAGAPWRGRSALDAVELMNVGWNYRREHLPLSQRSHYVITDGGDQPNVVPPTASVWYYFRQVTYPGIKEMWATGDKIAAGAAMMTDTTLLPTRVLGSAWPRHFNRAIAQVTQANIQKVGMPEWSEADQTFARAVQKELGVQRAGPDDARRPAGRPGRSGDQHRRRLGRHRRHLLERADGDAVAIRRTSPACPATTGSNGIAMATPIAHKGVTAGAKVQAMTLVDLLLKPEVVTAAWDYFKQRADARRRSTSR